jgi:hypothetical protein
MAGETEVLGENLPWRHFVHYTVIDGSSKTSSTNQVFHLIVPAQLKKFSYVSMY